MAGLEGRFEESKSMAEMWADKIKKLPSFISFFRIMRPRSELRGLKATDRRSLLKSLHKIAKRKLILEIYADFSRIRVHQARREEAAFLTLLDHLERASVHFQSACAELRDQLVEVEQQLPSDFRLSGQGSQESRRRAFSKRERLRNKADSERIAIWIKAASDCALEAAAWRVAAIHPSLRTPAEKKRAKRWLSRFEFLKTEGYPLIGVSTPSIDHWFIGQAYSRLLECERQLGDGRKLPNKAGILTQLFEVLFKEPRSPDNIRKELERQKKSGAPEYGWPVSAGLPAESERAYWTLVRGMAR